MDYIQVTKPGTYKRRKVQPKNRICSCGARLSIYNASTVCSVCSHKQFLTEYGDK